MSGSAWSGACVSPPYLETAAKTAAAHRAASKIDALLLVCSYSLGGLVARYVLGLLDSRSPSFFVTAAPCSFTTFASPAIGVPVYSGSRFSRIARAVGGNLLSRTGRQLYERDVFLPSARFDPGDKNEKPAGVRSRAKGRIRGEPLLKVMADPRFSFYRALAKFERFQVFANTCVLAPSLSLSQPDLT